jgi:hypothetical protein
MSNIYTAQFKLLHNKAGVFGTVILYHPSLIFLVHNLRISVKKLVCSELTHFHPSLIFMSNIYAAQFKLLRNKAGVFGSDKHFHHSLIFLVHNLCISVKKLECSEVTNTFTIV